MHVSMSIINRQLKEADHHNKTQTDDKNEANWAEQCLVGLALGYHQSRPNG
jgi:hypothetical protein